MFNAFNGTAQKSGIEKGLFSFLEWALSYSECSFIKILLEFLGVIYYGGRKQYFIKKDLQLNTPEEWEKIEPQLPITLDGNKQIPCVMVLLKAGGRT